VTLSVAVVFEMVAGCGRSASLLLFNMHHVRHLVALRVDLTGDCEKKREGYPS
jgi:hypothetical protein